MVDAIALSGRRVLGRALGWSALCSAGILLLNAMTGILLAHELGPELRGALAAALLWPMLLGGLGLLGLGEAVSYHAARGDIPDGALLGSALALALGLSAAVVALTAAILPFVLGQQSDSTVHSAYLYLGFIPTHIVTLVLACYVLGRGRLGWFQVLRILVTVVSAAGLVAVAVTDGIDVQTAVLVYLAASVLTAGITVAMVARLLNDRLRPSRAVARELLSFGLRSFAATAAWQSNERVDQPIIAALLPPKQLGLYVIAVTVCSLAGLVGASVVFVALPAVAAVTDLAERRQLARALIGFTLVASAALTVPLLLGARTLISFLFGPDFAVVASVARILLVASVVLSVNRAIEAVLTGIGRPGDAARGEILALPVTAIGLAVLLPTLGLVGAGWASLAAYVTAFTLMSRRAAAALELPWLRLLVPERRDLEALVRSRPWAQSKMPE